ncbi:amidohydrolase family protein [Chryseobacterium sp.]|uniref:amidohydrolase n=1 Tax=Chryseobacterium sp. TaxID=1871047 RepID=UPI0025C2AB34|nr:amidohydrolase family protein [Chryseobacterium sp.]MBV8328337.1 amidohydrolase family protein [Chryseobacterium sp.]
MEKSHNHTHGCTHCACNNPVLKILKEELFSQENLEKIQQVIKNKTSKAPLNLVISKGTGTILPMIGGSTESVDAIGIANGKVVITGKEDYVKAYMALSHPGYHTRELTGTQTLLPGLIEPHVHIVPAAMMKTGWMDVGPFKEQNLRADYDLEFVKSELKKWDFKNGEVILGRGLDPSLMPFVGSNELQKIDNKVLDGIYDKGPVILLSASMHTLYLNTKAFEYVFNNNDKVSQEYGTVDNYIKETQGQLQEALQMGPALQTVRGQILRMSKNINHCLTELFAEANKRGVTFMYDAGLDENFEILLKLYFKTHDELVRTGGAYLCAGQEDVDKLHQYREPEEYKQAYRGHIKIVSDGSNQGLTGYQSARYKCEANYPTGVFNFPQTGIPAHTIPPSYNTLINTAVAVKGWPLMIHANGDQAVTFAINAYQRTLARYKGPELRNRIEHCSLLTADQITNMLQMGVSPSFLIGHVGYWGYAFKEVIFGEKAQMLDLCGSTLAAGMRISLHSDNEVSPLGPLRMMEQSITRIMEKKPGNIEVLNSAECLTPEQALIAVTYDAAWQCYADKWVGSLHKGHFADFVILDENPLSLNTQSSQYMKMRDIPVSETWVGGIPVYEKNPKVLTEKDIMYSENS